MMTSFVCRIDGEQAMVALGRLLGDSLAQGGTVFFHGDLGSGKTTLCRGVLRACGHTGAVKSPTYTLVEPYRYLDMDIFHFDFYRLGDPRELEYIGIREYFGSNKICLVEWPEQGSGLLPEADLDIFLEHLNAGRMLKLVASSERGLDMLDKIRDRHAISD